MKLRFIGIAAASLALSVPIGVTVILFHSRATADPISTVRTAPVEALHNDERESMEPIHPIPLHLELDQKRVALGAQLFSDTRLSANGTVACASCHSLAHGGADEKARSIGIHGQVGSVNTLSVFNSGFNFRLFWDGRAATLEEQVAGPLLNAQEMGSNWPQLLARLRQDPKLMRVFADSYADGLTAPNLENAIATFERSLYTPNSRFDQYLRGNSQAISADEKRGYQIFKSYGCATCHQGVNVGGNMFEKFGLMADYFADRGGETKADLGRYNVTGLDEDRHVFKVPSLRLAALTAPYFHDGSARNLEDAVRVMAKYQLGRKLSADDVRLIVLFLKTLPGEYQGRPLLSESGQIATRARR
jgi:cytochrome c peroxidase